MAALDLSDIGVVDNHCHAVLRAGGPSSASSWRALFTESPHASMQTVDVADTAFYRRLMTELARELDVEGDEEAVLAARSAVPPGQLAARLFQAAGIEAFVVDTGIPAASVALTPAEMATTGDCAAVGLLRLELLFQDLVAQHASYDVLVQALRDRLSGLRDKGFVGFKSIAAYRTGLDVRQWPAADLVASFRQARAEVAGSGAVRLGHKPLLDSLLHVAFQAAAEQELPVQFHVGYGDPDADLRLADPLLLRAVLEEPRYRTMPVVLLHGCWPFVREGAFLAAVYAHAHLDLSYAIPFLSRQEQREMTRAALGAVPTSKLMYSSDGVGVPELHWMGALDGRRALGTCLGELVADGDITPAQARRSAEQVLRDNARVLYGITGS